MRFGWNRAAAAEIVDVDHAAAAPYEVAAIELLTDEGCMVGWIATGGERTSDWLNEHAELPVHGLARREDRAAQQPPELPTAGATHLERDRIIWVVPPPLPPNRHLRLHRRRVRVHLEFDDYEMIGQVHVRPGADASDHLLRGSRVMVPLTDAFVTSRIDADDRSVLPVVIINVGHVRRLVAEGPHRATATEDEPVVEHVVGDLATDGPLAGVEGAPVSVEASPLRSTEATAALVTLLDAGVIDVVEFQAMRARIRHDS